MTEENTEGVSLLKASLEEEAAFEINSGLGSPRPVRSRVPGPLGGDSESGEPALSPYNPFFDRWV
jgi:hypothetical protein